MHCTKAAAVYALAAAVSSAFLLSRNADTEVRWLALVLFWLVICAVPLLFVFAYPRFLFSVSSRRGRCELVLQSTGAVAATALFPVLALPYWENPVAKIGNSVAVLVVPLAVLAVFLVAAIFLLLNRKPSVATVASVLFWPYWLLFALTYTGRFFQDTTSRAVFCFLCLAMPVMFAFAAGAVAYRPVLAHAIAIAGCLGLPWLYWDVMKDSGLGNVWLIFNVPDDGIEAYRSLYPYLAILTVAMVVLAIASAVLEVLPSNWKLRRVPVRDRTWPAFVVCFVSVAIWFSQSVMPYRLPGAVDYSDYPILWILHVEKHGLEFHETGVRVWQRRNALSVTQCDRRLFQYRFQQQGSLGKLSDPVMEHVRAGIPQNRLGDKSDRVKPLREWNADAWYVMTENSALKVYRADKGILPPEQVVNLFHELLDDAGSRKSTTEHKDVCLGFCWDARSAMGFLFANHRCFNDGSGTKCR